MNIEEPEIEETNRDGRQNDRNIKKIGEKSMIARTPKGDDTSTRVWGYVCEDVSIVGKDMVPKRR